ncbi:MAG: hypothetical protein J0H99_24790, partial [Rhodospirillales bacterium]|nr:hypothetical protein [Rhodospirillales bacterium]
VHDAFTGYYGAQIGNDRVALGKRRRVGSRHCEAGHKRSSVGKWSTCFTNLAAGRQSRFSRAGPTFFTLESHALFLPENRLDGAFCGNLSFDQRLRGEFRHHLRTGLRRCCRCLRRPVLMNSFEDLEIFARVVSAGSMSAAGRRAKSV